MAVYRILPAARSDLAQIRAYILRGNPRRAVTFVQELILHFELLAANPMIGQARPELGADLRSSPHGSYIIFHVPSSDGVTIVRVLHGARDLGQLF